MNYFPLQILAIASEMPEIGEFDVSLAQGRWTQTFLPKVNSHFQRPIDSETQNLDYELP